MNMDFDSLFDSSVLPDVLAQARTLCKEECREIFKYMDIKRPKTIMEFGVQYGCSSRVFVEMGNWFGYKVNLHSWDIADQVRESCISKLDFNLHIMNVTGSESEVIEKYAPDLIFLDAHPYKMTKSLMSECLSRKIDFMCHDVELELLERARKQSKNFIDFNVYVDWELYILGQLISKSLFDEDHYENDEIVVDCIRGNNGGGLAIIQNKEVANG